MPSITAPKKLRGLTLIEALFVFSIVAVVIGVLLALTRATYVTSKAHSDVMAVQDLAAGVKRLRGKNYGSFVNLMPSLAAANLVPRYIINRSSGTTVYQNSWGGTYSVFGYTTMYTVSLDRVTSDGCRLLMNMMPEGKLTAVRRSLVTTTQVPPSSADVANLCTYDGESVITYEFG